ncbi:MAG: hypothetical protein P4L31_08160 [Candidatus Babeliales bacterium]|nr:hypothetical protein [Candidatus Babeliales bacterium]
MKSQLKIAMLALLGLVTAQLDCAQAGKNIQLLHNFTEHPLYAAYYYDMGTRFERPKFQPKDEPGSLFTVKPNRSMPIVKLPKKSSLFDRKQRNLVVTHDKNLLTPTISLIDNQAISAEYPNKYRLPDGLYQVHVADKETKRILCYEDIKEGIICSLCDGKNLNDPIAAPCGRILNRLKLNSLSKKGSSIKKRPSTKNNSPETTKLEHNNTARDSFDSLFEDDNNFSDVSLKK